MPEIPISKGVDVMITIFCDFHRFAAKKLAFFLIFMILFLQNSAVFWVKKTPLFRLFSGLKYFQKNQNIGPRKE
jgi:hypothetical protein